MERYEEEGVLARRDQIQNLANELKKRTFVARSEDGLVKVRALGTGEIIGLELDPRIYRTPNADELAATIVRTIQKAASGAARAHLKGLEEITGGASGSFQDLLKNANELADKLFKEADDLRR
ncbi:hypothetical protein GCM10023196_083730 [Actinoallomurus vinaceus]|uniref:YbaB/EbfC family nucleoid-associated protein n=1 Tax=Actinoallomurus vinaceus TaxID=1080074 RepID=A0ABP8UR10_9ACTN